MKVGTHNVLYENALNTTVIDLDSTPLENITPNSIDVDLIKASYLELQVSVVDYNQVRIDYEYDGKKTFVIHEFADAQEPVNIKQLIPNCDNIDLDIDKNGSININSCDPDVNLNLTTIASITNSASFACKNLNLTGGSILLEHGVKVKGDCTLSYQASLLNKQKLQVRNNLIFTGSNKGALVNDGDICAAGQIKINQDAHHMPVYHATREIINNGTIYSGDELTINAKQLFNNNIILSPQKIYGFGKKFINLGYVISEQNMHFGYSDYIINQKAAIICSQKNINLLKIDLQHAIDVDELPPASNLINQGKIQANGKLRTHNLEGIVANEASGSLVAKDLFVGGDEFINNGSLNSDCLEVILSDNGSRWYNNATGEVSTRELTYSAQQLINQGSIYTQQTHDGLLTKTLINKSSGQIISDANIKLQALRAIINDCLVQAAEQLMLHSNYITVNMGGQLLANHIDLASSTCKVDGTVEAKQACNIISARLDNFMSGNITAKELKLATEQLQNAGKITAKTATVLGAETITNSASGIIKVNEELNARASVINNTGLISAEQGTINLQAINNFNQQAYAKVMANLLNITSAKVKLSGEISAQVAIVLDAAQAIVKRDGKVTSVGTLQFSGNRLFNSGNFSAKQTLYVNAQEKTVQAATGIMEAEQGIINTGILENKGVLSFGNLKLTADSLKNLYNAIIESATSMTLTARELENAGIIEAYGQLQLKIIGCLNNLAHGHINALQDLLIEAGCILKNAGFINADAQALIKLSDNLTNEATGIITAKTFDLKGGWTVNNYGKILAQSQLQIDIDDAINNYQSGSISSEQALKIISSNLHNHGTVTANQLDLALQNILENYEEGRIDASHALNLIGAKLILNAGEIASANNLNAKTIQLLENLKTGKITAKNQLNLIAELIIENNGILAANHLKLTASQLLLNGELHSKQLEAKGKVIAGDGIIDGGAIDFTADLVRIDGKLIASSLSIEAKNYLQLLKNGSITCTEASKLMTQAGFVNLGKILNHNKLAIIAKDVFHDATASLAAEGELYIKAINAYLDGDLEASQNLFLLVTNQFEYNTAKLTANGELHLTLKDGSEVKQNISTAGDLKIEFLTNNGVWYNEQQLVAGGELTLDVPGVIFVNGKSSKSAMLQAKKNINLYGQGLDTGCGTIQADKLNTHTTVDIKLNKDSNIDVNSVLLHTDAGKIEQQTALKLTGDAELLATQCEPIIYPIADATGAIKQFKPNPVTNADGADALAAIYQLAGTKEVGWAARIKASQQLKEHIEDPVVHQLITEEVTAALLSVNDLSTLASIGLTLTTEELTLLGYYKLANGSSKVDARDQKLLAEELQELVENKLLTYIETSIEKSKFWFGLSARSSGIMGAIGHINNINFNVFTDTTDGKPQQASITKLCTHNTQPDAPIHNIYVKANKENCQFALLTEITAKQNPVNSTITVEQPIQAKTVKVMADGKITITSQIEADANNLIESLCADVEIKSLKARSGNHENFDDYILSQARVAAGKLLSIKGVNIILQKAETASGEAGTYIEALANILDIPVDLMSQRIQHFYQKRKSGHIRDTYLRQHTSLHQSKGNFNSFAGNSSSYYAPTIEAQEAIIASTNETTLFADVQDSHEHHEDIRTKKRRWYGGYKKTHKQASSVRSTSHGTRFKVKKLKVSGANVKLRNVHSSAEHNLFAAPNGKVSILQGVNRIAAVNLFTSSEPLWQRQSSKQENHTTYSASTFTGTIEIAAKTAEIEVVCGQLLSFLNQITLKPEDTVYKTLYEHHEVHTESKEGPGAALIALVALATTLATQGMASGWATGLLSGTTSGFTHAAITAGFQSIMAQAASAIVANNGDLDKALKDLFQKDTLKKLATTMLSAGVMDKVASGLKLPKVAVRSMPQNVVYNLTKATVDAGLAAGISGKEFDKVLQENLINAAFATLGNKIDLLDISKNNNTLLHTMLGSARGTVNKDGWLPGMLESVISARLPEYIEKLKLKRHLKEQAKNELLKNKAKLTPNEQQQKLLQIITAKINELAKEQGCSIQQKNILHKLITENLATFRNQQELNEWGEKFYFSKAAVTNAGIIKELPLIVAIAANFPAEMVIGGVVITSLCAAALVVYGFEKYKEYKNNAARFKPHTSEPTILVTPQADILPKIPGFDSPEAIPSTSTEFPGELVEIVPGVFVPSDYIPDISGFPDASSEFNRPVLLFSKQKNDGGNRYGGGKNAPHANKNARNSAKEKYEEAKAEYERLRKAQGKTSETVQQRNAAKKQMEHWKRKMDFSGESHSQKPKGGSS